MEGCLPQRSLVERERLRAESVAETGSILHAHISPILHTHIPSTTTTKQLPRARNARRRQFRMMLRDTNAVYERPFNIVLSGCAIHR
eukprot:6178260-Pleurochrysis_carterae.AAC.1